MWLWYVWHPHYGVIYDELQQTKAGNYGFYDLRQVEVENKREQVLQSPLFHGPRYACG